jgi:hypothetical protein
MKKTNYVIASVLMVSSLFLLTGCEPSAREKNCISMGGHYYNPPGKASNLCLTEDGRILEV